MANKIDQKIEKNCYTCIHNELLLNQKCVGCINYINSNITSVLKWEENKIKIKKS